MSHVRSRPSVLPNASPFQTSPSDLSSQLCSSKYCLLLVVQSGLGYQGIFFVQSVAALQWAFLHVCVFLCTYLTFSPLGFECHCVMDSSVPKQAFRSPALGAVVLARALCTIEIDLDPMFANKLM